jgi:2-pyrone-4,6-dicarboxylate lactonase
MRFEIPEDACDCHVHIVGPESHYPKQQDRAYTPPEASVVQLRAHLAGLRMSRVVLIQPSFYGCNNSCLVNALRELGPLARGVAVIEDSTTDAELEALSAAGVKGVRVNLESQGVNDEVQIKRALRAVADRIGSLGWHVQIYAASHMIVSAAEAIASLSVSVVLDHFAMVRAELGNPYGDLGPILDLMRGGHAYVKLSAPYRIVKAGGHCDIAGPLARHFVEANPERVLWGSDWPHTNRAPGVKPSEVSPYREIDNVWVLNWMGSWVPEQPFREKILTTNPATLYDF